MAWNFRHPIEQQSGIKKAGPQACLLPTHKKAPPPLSSRAPNHQPEG